MTKVQRISSKSENRFIDVMEHEDGYYLLHQFIRKYDAEEDKYYEVRALPDPSGRFGDFSSAVLEAQRVMNLSN